ncbi:hypothetical protein QQS21_005135 [Conoideocrella luteorostrata]|uniref:Uncharacterized protein n=1 Tax=Conoideocrella luteorostrata TaxID=1105319 RepID=A0AAJ0FZC3_9HYPO|nr:hypothetical protein QQS21_005135 [Conoideocrella luteorostrata]
MHKKVVLTLTSLLCFQLAKAGVADNPIRSTNSWGLYNEQRGDAISHQFANAKVVTRRDTGDDQTKVQLDKIDSFTQWITRAPIRNDCFFVTCAVLLGTTPEDISQRTGLPIPPESRPGEGRGVSIDEMIQALTRLGIRFRTWSFRRGSNRGVSEALALPPRGLPRVVGVAYRRPDGTGHVVIARNPGTEHRRYIDYQASPSGRDVTEDVRMSRIFAYIHVDIDASSGEFFTTQRPMIERMEIDYGEQDLEPMEVDEGEPDRIFDDQLQQLRRGEFNRLPCAAFIAFWALSKNNHHKRLLPSQGLRPRAITDCDKARYLETQLSLEDKPPCSKIKDLEFGFKLSEDLTAGTYDRIGAILEGPAGKAEFTIADDPPRGFSTRIPVDLKSSFGSDAIAINGINAISLTAESWRSHLIPNDEWKVEGIKLHAKCVKPGFEISDNRLISLNAWFQHPDASWVPFTSSDKKIVRKLKIAPTDWDVSPLCVFIKNLKYSFKLGDDWFSGADGPLSFKIGESKQIIIGKDLPTESSRSAYIDLKKVFGKDIVDIRDIKSLELFDQARSKKAKRDEWLLQGIQFEAICADDDKGMALKKFGNKHQWFGKHPQANGAVFRGEIVPSDWKEMKLNPYHY